MSSRALLIVIIVCGVSVWIASTPLGAMIGFIIGIAIAFFVAPVVFGVMFAFNLPDSAAQPILNGLMLAYGALVLLFAVRGLLAWMRGEADAARGLWATAIVMGTLAAVAWFSMMSLQAAWP